MWVGRVGGGQWRRRRVGAAAGRRVGCRQALPDVVLATATVRPAFQPRRSSACTGGPVWLLRNWWVASRLLGPLSWHGSRIGTGSKGGPTQLELQDKA